MCVHTHIHKVEIFRTSDSYVQNCKITIKISFREEIFSWEGVFTLTRYYKHTFAHYARHEHEILKKKGKAVMEAHITQHVHECEKQFGSSSSYGLSIWILHVTQNIYIYCSHKCTAFLFILYLKNSNRTGVVALMHIKSYGVRLNDKLLLTAQFSF